MLFSCRQYQCLKLSAVAQSLEGSGTAAATCLETQKYPPNQRCLQDLASLVLWETGPWEVRQWQYDLHSSRGEGSSVSGYYRNVREPFPSSLSYILTGI